MEIKDLSEGLKLKTGDDGYWLCFEGPNGKSAMLNLNNIVDGKRIIKSAVLGWAENNFSS